MTIKDLIAKLSEYPQNTIVSVDGYEGGVTDFIGIHLSSVILNQNEERYYGEHESDDSGKSKHKRVVLARVSRGDTNEDT
jgi:hypothetical protein